MNDDRERLERYLHWRDRTQGPRRRWLRRAGVMLAPLIVVFGLLAWLAQSRAPIRPGPATSATKLSPPNDSARAERAAPSRPSETESSAVAPRPSPTDRGAAGPSPKKFVAPAPDRQTQSLVPVTPPSSATSETQGSGDTPAAGVSPSRSSETQQSVGPNVVAPSTSPEHRSQEAAIPKSSCADVAATSVDRRSRAQRIVDCVGGWLEGESQEFRAGLEREIEEFRSGIDKVGLGLQWLGGKLRRP